ncbi:P-loop containing nucleoside triphosphate hydrolase protein [Protomyces lactucae-debilis]|uniref:p-loop containing nucleoside triphosphate hydrolase protein n=1 Tax=Protomyces lactucae-debilis TaxID=2754530 RepID=A0A1Y2F5G1_PROLT|nr:P-loop containing nucleoside triphosphate hydrolase protein [Protomyces lactucae-debilis]ORY79099.1 P-loop containing nucleoside triphosphate hydrolase protein [Protomyces lactucae-debilis]
MPSIALTEDTLGQRVKQILPHDIDHLISDYCAGYIRYALDNPDISFESINAVRNICLSCQADPQSVDDLCRQFQHILEHKKSGTKGLAKLNHAVNMASERQVSNTMGLLGGTTDLEATARRKVASQVDRKKLAKAELKIAAKLAKKEMKADYEASRLLDEPESVDDYDENFLKVNPLTFESSTGKSKDIRLDGIDINFAGLRILTDASLTLAHGRRYGLVGRNGIGKSTLLKALSRRELPVPAHLTILHVEQEITGDDTTALQAVLDADVWRKYLYAEQESITKRSSEVANELVAMPTEDPGRWALEKEQKDLDAHLMEVQFKLTDIDAEKAESRAATILAGLGFTPERQQLATKSFSGGWRMRLALARALFCKPDLLLLDEPSNMLDVPSVAFLANYLSTYENTVLVVSHDRAFLNEVATDIIYQHNERLDYYRGNFTQFYATKEERRKNAIREYESQMAYRKHLQAFIDKFRYNAAKSSEAQSRIKKLEKLPILEAPETDDEVTFRFPEAEKISPPVLQMTDVSFSYGDKQILKNVDLDVQLDSRVAVIGPNGAGKTTMLKLLIEQLTPSGGLVQRHPRLRVAYFAQHHVDGLELNLSAVGFMAKYWPGRSEEEYRRHLAAFGLTGTLGLGKMVTLSGGQKSRVAFACLSLQNPHILVLDEPTNHLDIEAMDALMAALKEFNGGVILVSHDVTFLSQTSDVLWLCQEGTVTKFPGTIDQYKKKVLESADEQGLGGLVT